MIFMGIRTCKDIRIWDDCVHVLSFRFWDHRYDDLIVEIGGTEANSS